MENDVQAFHPGRPFRSERLRRVRRGGLARLALGLAAVCVLPGCGEDPPPLWAATGTASLEQASPARGMQAIAKHGCTSCHAIPGVRGSGARVGPALDEMARRAYVAGVLPNTPENLVRWLRDPPAIDPRTVMPNVGLTDEEAADIAAYLLTLR